MFNLFKKKQDPKIRNVLFGDLPVAEWARDSLEGEPGRSFAEARESLDAGQTNQAIEAWQRILGIQDLESRHYVQAWHFLREAGVQPGPDEEKHVYGVVVELAFDKGLDLVAAYEDGRARYFGFNGAGIVWDVPEGPLRPQIDALLHAGQTVAERIGPWAGTRPSAPPKGQVRVNMLTPSGLHFGQATFDAIARDALGSQAFAAATALMQALIAMGKQTKGRRVRPE